jgi:hypothetical protein
VGRVRVWRDRIVNMTKEPESYLCFERNPTLEYPYLLADLVANPEYWDA